MPIRRSPNGPRHTPPQPGRDRPEWVVAINRNARSQSVGISGRNQSVRATDVGSCQVFRAPGSYCECKNWIGEIFSGVVQ
jgi:hypothetical protein